MKITSTHVKIACGAFGIAIVGAGIYVTSLLWVLSEIRLEAEKLRAAITSQKNYTIERFETQRRIDDRQWTAIFKINERRDAQ